MTGGLGPWFASRTAREQLLLKGAAFVIVAGSALLIAYQAAAEYRSTSAANLAGAQQVQDDLVRLKSLGSVTAAAPLPANDGSVRGISTATASQFALSPARIEPDGPTSVRLAFEPANAQSIYQWLDAVERAGLVVSRFSLVRAGDGDIVEAGATIMSR